MLGAEPGDLGSVRPIEKNVQLVRELHQTANLGAQLARPPFLRVGFC